MNDLSGRLLNFASGCIKCLRKYPNSEEYRIIKNQLIKSSTSIGANYEEAQGASSKADFTNKVRISLKEARESNYWLRLIKEISSHDSDKPEINKLIKEQDAETIE